MALSESETLHRVQCFVCFQQNYLLNSLRTVQIHIQDKYTIKCTPLVHNNWAMLAQNSALRCWQLIVRQVIVVIWRCALGLASCLCAMLPPRRLMSVQLSTVCTHTCVAPVSVCCCAAVRACGCALEWHLAVHRYAAAAAAAAAKAFRTNTHMRYPPPKTPA